MPNVAAIDVASYQPRDLSGLIATHQPAHVVVKLYLPEEAISQEHSRAQLRSARDAGCSVGGYVWCYGTADPTKTVHDAIELARSCGVELPVLWLDCESYTVSGVVRDPGPDAAWLHAAAAACRALGVRPGIYTGGWWWGPHMNDSNEFTDLPLWAAQYDGDPDLATVRPFGGWAHACGKQWSDNPVDRDVFLEEVCTVGPRRGTLAALESSNPGIRQQLAEWQRARRDIGQDPYDYAAFRLHLTAVAAPNPGDEEFEEFCPRGMRALRAANPGIGAQLAGWQADRRTAGQDPYDYGAFRQHLTAIAAPDPGEAEFEGFRG